MDDSAVMRGCRRIDVHLNDLIKGHPAKCDLDSVCVGGLLGMAGLMGQIKHKSSERHCPCAVSSLGSMRRINDELSGY